jgi:hypothetical protein
MKAKLLLAAIVLIAACSKSPSPSPVPPPNGADTTQKHDTTPPPPHDTTPKPPAPPTEIPGVTKISGTLNWDVDLYKGLIMVGGGIGTDIELVDYDTAYCSAEIINAYKATCTIKYYALNGDTTVAFVFSNQDYWTSEAACDNPDTAGIVQIHVYRKDGKNIKPGVKDVYMPLGSASGNVIGQGQMAINSYTGICAKLTLDSLVKFIGSRSTMTLQNFDGF